jgi:heme-degrading monooxygenase HmoA
MKCVELVIYKVKPDKNQEFLEVYGWIRREMSTMPGFVSAETLQSLDDAHTYADLWIWESIAHAKDAHIRFASLPHAKQFTAVVDRVLHSGHFVPSL